MGNKDAEQLRHDVELIEASMSRFRLQPTGEGAHSSGLLAVLSTTSVFRNCWKPFIEIAPVPQHRITEERDVRPDETPFSGFAFKIHANIDPRHRDRIAFLRVVSAPYRNTVYKHVRLDKNLRFNNPYTFMAASKDVIEEAYPGDVIGLYDTGNFKIGDSSLKAKHFTTRVSPSFSGTVHGIDQCRSYEV